MGKQQTHCYHGHPLTPDNVITRKDGKRRCRPCTHAYKKEGMRPRTHCRRGHEYTPANLGHDSRGRRKCLQCQRDASRRKKGTAVPQGAPALPREEAQRRFNARTPTYVANLCRDRASARVAASAKLWEEWFDQRGGVLPAPCAWGHPVQPSNVYLHRPARRDGRIYHHCRECSRLRTREHKKARTGRLDVFDLVKTRTVTDKEAERERIAAALRRHRRKNA